jgi:hypothetical protein
MRASKFFEESYQMFRELGCTKVDSVKAALKRERDYKEGNFEK